MAAHGQFLRLLSLVSWTNPNHMAAHSKLLYLTKLALRSLDNVLTISQYWSVRTSVATMWRQFKLQPCEDVEQINYFKTLLWCLHNFRVTFLIHFLLQLLVIYWVIEMGLAFSMQTHQLKISVETTLIVNFHQRCFNVDICLKLKFESTYVYIVVSTFTK